MSRLLVKEDAFWRQRAKTHWLREGDLNTRFFHAAATSRRKVNRISSLVDSSGTQYTENSDLCNAARNYFTDIFQRQNSTLSPVLDVIVPTISLDDNMNLTAPFTFDEFRRYIFYETRQVPVSRWIQSRILSAFLEFVRPRNL
jgi:hypothetical protein